MNKKRLLELAGISSNMSNPSHEPATDVPDNMVEVPAHVDLGDEGETTEESIVPQIKTAAAQGVLTDNIEEARDLFKQILTLVGGE